MTVIVQPKPKRWTKAEYRSLLDWYGEDWRHSELIDGEIIQMPPQTEVHAYALRLADDAVRRVFRRGYVFVVQSPLDLSSTSEPEPDVMVVKGDLRTLRKHPKTAELIIELAWGSLAYDRDTKGSLYASRGIRDYWIVNLHNNTVEIRRRPTKDADAQFGYSYADTEVLSRGESIAPLAAPKSKIKVADLLP